MASFSLLAPEEVAALVANWPIALRSSRHLGGGLNNTSYLLDTDDGRLVMTIADFPAGLPTEMHAALLQHLRECGLPVTEPLKNIHGTHVVDHDGKAVMLKRYIEGSAPSELDTEQLAHLGELVARVATADVPPGIRKAKRRLPSNLSKIVEDWSDLGFAAWIIEQSQRIETLTAASLETGLVHGDLFADNTIIDESGEMFLIDWETASIDMLVLDIGFAVLGNCRTTDGVDVDRAATLLEGYESVRPLGVTEQGHLIDATAYAATIIGFWRYQNLKHLHVSTDRADLYKEMVPFVASLESGLRF